MTDNDLCRGNQNAQMKAETLINTTFLSFDHHAQVSESQWLGLVSIVHGGQMPRPLILKGLIIICPHNVQHTMRGVYENK